MILLFIRLDFVETGPRWIISNILFMYEIFFADASISLLPLPQMTAWTSRPLPLIFPPYQPHLHLSIDQETSRQFSLHQYHLLTRGISNHEFRNFLGSYTKSLVYHVGYRHISSVESCDDSKRQQFRQYHPEIIQWNFDTSHQMEVNATTHLNSRCHARDFIFRFIAWFWVKLFKW